MSYSNWEYINSEELEDGGSVSKFKNRFTGHIENVVLTDIESKCMTHGEVCDRLLRQVGEYKSVDGLAGMISNMFGR